MSSPPRKLKCLVVDDEPLAAELLAGYIATLPELELAGICHHALDAFTALQRQPVDLIFLDIQMPQLTGLQFLRALAAPPAVILTTAYREYAVEGFELNVVDYLVKPVPLDRFLRAVGRVLTRHQLPVPPPSAPLVAPAPDPYMYFKVDKEMVKVYLRDILWIESLKDYVKIQTSTRLLVTYQRITFLEEKLPDHAFLRVHRSYIVAKDKISGFSHGQVRVGAKEIPIGKSYKQDVFRRLESLGG
ncbi:LytR/AlgR family response regulator transcription factor [Hymenobacter sp. HD11105]|jgi:DNA-binding LytR/AlgR family response regulator